MPYVLTISCTPILDLVIRDLEDLCLQACMSTCDWFLFSYVVYEYRFNIDCLDIYGILPLETRNGR